MIRLRLELLFMKGTTSDSFYGSGTFAKTRCQNLEPHRTHGSRQWRFAPVTSREPFEWGFVTFRLVAEVPGTFT